MNGKNVKPPEPHPGSGPLGRLATRRGFLAGALGGAAALALPRGASALDWETFLQKHFSEMSPAELKRALQRLEERHAREYGRAVNVAATPPLPGVRYGYGLDLARCIGCRRCEWACVRENNISRTKGQGHWIRVLRLPQGNLIRLEEAEHHYEPPTVPEEGHFYMPVQCQHCDNPPCVKACPVRATWQEPDGLVVVDYNWCIGCRFCISACPYRGRTFNWARPTIPPEELTTDTHYLGNRPRPRNVVDKCTFCVQRVRHPDGRGRYPACVEACPTGTRKFGNLLDPESEIRVLMATKRVFRLKEDLNTEPKFYYFFSL